MGTPKSSILVGIPIINHPFWGTPILGNLHMMTGPAPKQQRKQAAGGVLGEIFQVNIVKSADLFLGMGVPQWLDGS